MQSPSCQRWWASHIAGWFPGVMFKWSALTEALPGKQGVEAGMWVLFSLYFLNKEENITQIVAWFSPEIGQVEVSWGKNALSFHDDTHTRTHTLFRNNLQVKQLFEFIFNTDCGATDWRLHKFCSISVVLARLWRGSPTKGRKLMAAIFKHICMDAFSPAGHILRAANSSVWKWKWRSEVSEEGRCGPLTERQRQLNLNPHT